MNKIADKVYSSQEVADILGISRIAVFNKIKKGDINAHKVGRNYVIHSSDLLFEDNIPQKTKDIIKSTVKRAIEEYGDVFKRLGKE